MMPFRCANSSGKRASFSANIATSVVTNIVIAALTLITGTVAARMLHPSGRGQLAAIQVFPAVVGTLAMLGLWEAVVYISSSRPSDSGRALGSAVLATLLVSPLFVLVGYFAVPWVLSAQESSIIAAGRFYLWLVPIFSVLYLPLHALRSAKSLGAWNFARTMPVLGWLLVLGIAAVAGHKTPEWISRAQIICLVVLTIPMWIITLKHLHSPVGVNFGLLKEMLKYGIPSAAGAVPQNLNLKLDQMLMAALVPPKLLGLYVVAVAWSSAVAPLMSGIAQPLLPKIASHGSPEERLTVLSQVLRIAAAVSVVLVALLAIATPLALPMLFGKDYRAAIACGVVLVIASGFSGLNYVLQEGVRGLADTPAVLYSELTGLALTGLSLLLLLPTWGIMGAAIASLLGYSSTTAFLLVRLHIRTGAPIRKFVLTRKSDIATVRRRLVPKAVAVRAASMTGTQA